MRAVFINPCHPDTAHVCGLRARSFADSMAARGHQIVLLTPPLNETGSGPDARSIGDALGHHDWQKPYRLTVPHEPDSYLPKVRRGDMVSGLRQALIGFHYARHGSVYEDWCRGARAYFPALRESFGPDVVWAVFGHTGCWRAGQELAAIASCPWVMDAKDSWTAFIPALFRRLLARRFGNAAHITALSAAHASQIRRWFPGHQCTVVHSGLPASLVSGKVSGPPESSKSKSIFLCGSIYETAHLETIAESLARWLDHQEKDMAHTIRLAYAGSETEAFMSSVRPLSNHCAVETLGHIPLDRLHAEMKTAAINLHLYFPPVLFHHKLFELIAANRPILAFPGESDEAQSIAGKTGARLYRCETADDLMHAFDAVLGKEAEAQPSISFEQLSRYSWENQAKVLETALETAIQTP